MNEFLLIIGIALALDFLLSQIPKRKRPNIRIEESAFGTILVSDDCLTDADRKKIIEAFDSLNRGPRDISEIRENGFNSAGEFMVAVGKAKEIRNAILSIQEIDIPSRVGGKHSTPVVRRFRIVVACADASPVELAVYMPIQYGDALEDDPELICQAVNYERKHKTRTLAIWEVDFTYHPNTFFENIRVDESGNLVIKRR